MKKQLLLLLTFMSAFAMNAQVTLVKEINDSGTSSSLPANLFVFNNKIYFAADDSSGSNTPTGLDLGKELWITDGTETGTISITYGDLDQLDDLCRILSSTQQVESK